MLYVVDSAFELVVASLCGPELYVEGQILMWRKAHPFGYMKVFPVEADKHRYEAVERGDELLSERAGIVAAVVPGVVREGAECAVGAGADEVAVRLRDNAPRGVFGKAARVAIGENDNRLLGDDGVWFGIGAHNERRQWCEIESSAPVLDA